MYVLALGPLAEPAYIGKKVTLPNETLLTEQLFTKIISQVTLTNQVSLLIHSFIHSFIHFGPKP